jgi:hypothetical protein
MLVLICQSVIIPLQTQSASAFIRKHKKTNNEGIMSEMVQASSISEKD